MAMTTVSYVSNDEDKKQKTRNISTDIRVFYLKTTIVVLALALVAVSSILIWQLLTVKGESNCQDQVRSKAKDEVNSRLRTETMGQKTSRRKNKENCRPIIDKNLLPYSLPSKIRMVLEDVGGVLRQEVEKKTLVSISSSALYRDDTVWKAGFGVVDKSIRPKEIPDENTQYQTGSLVKLLTTLMAFKLLQEKKLRCLNDPLHKYAPDFSVKNPFNEDVITIRHILTHTSGLPREAPCGPSLSSSFGNLCPINTTYVFSHLANTKLKFAPGTSVGYSNLGYALLSHCLYQRFGSDYATWQQWMFYEILFPLGMKDTVLDEKRFYSNVAVSYKENGIITPDLNWGWSSPSFHMYTSTSDLTKLITSLVSSKHSFLQEGVIREMFNPEYVYPDLQTMFSPGWLVYDQNSLRVVSKAGAIPGSSGALFLIPEVRFGFVLLTTGREIASTLATEISEKLTNAFANGFIGSSLKIQTPPYSSRYIGDYILDNNWTDKVLATISVELFSGHLKLHQEPGYPPFVYLSFIESHLLQIIYPRGLSCTVYGLGQDKEFITFQDFSSKGLFQKFVLGSFVFKRITR